MIYAAHRKDVMITRSNTKTQETYLETPAYSKIVFFWP